MKTLAAIYYCSFFPAAYLSAAWKEFFDGESLSDIQLRHCVNQIEVARDRNVGEDERS